MTITSIDTVLSASPVIPVIVIENVADAVPLATALFEAGLRCLEITLRSDAATESIAEIKSALPDALVGAGTVNSLTQLQQCEKAEVDFMVSPGFYPPLVKAADDSGIAYLPGVASASEVMQANNSGYFRLKFFPAEAAGGVAMLKSLAGPFADSVFCPTGGIGADNCSTYLELGNVACVGGSWVAPGKLIEQKRWPELAHTAKSELLRLTSYATKT